MTEIESLRAEVARLTAERDALRVDAERYRWLWDKFAGRMLELVFRVTYNLKIKDKQTADAAIDAARAAKGTT